MASMTSQRFDDLTNWRINDFYDFNYLNGLNDLTNGPLAVAQVNELKIENN